MRLSRAPRGRARGALFALVMTLAWPCWAIAGGDGNMPLSGRGPLDGMNFVGDLGPADEPADRRDSLHFDDGQFWSGSCVPCGYPPGAYWVRVTDEGIHFRGVLRNPEGGRFVYVGIVRDGRLTATINWRRERWYWTIDRNFWFEGTTATADGAHATPAAARQAASTTPSPSRDCEP